MNIPCPARVEGSVSTHDVAMVLARLRGSRGRIAALGLGALAVSVTPLFGCTLRCGASVAYAPVSDPQPLPDDAPRDVEARREYCVQLCRNVDPRASCSLLHDEDAYVCVETVTASCSAGRPPRGSRYAPGSPTDALEAALRAQASAELASVAAFDQLAAELAHHGYARFGEEARAFALDERAHAALLFGLAADAAPLEVRVPSRSPRSLVEVALENAREGCVLETFGAAVALHQAEHARGAELREAFARIALDEARHARFAWALHGALRRAVGVASAARVDAALRDEVAALRARVAHDEPTGLDALGVPTAVEAAAIVDGWLGAFAA